MDRRSMATLICDGAARSCFHTQASLSRSVIGSAGPPGGGSKPADSVPGGSRGHTLRVVHRSSVPAHPPTSGRLHEKHAPALRTRYLHGHHGVVPPMALIAPFARVARSTNRSTPDHDDHRMPAADRYRLQGLDMPGLRQAGDVIDLDNLPFFINRVEDAVPPGPQAPQIR